MLPGYDYVVKCSHVFNLLEARGAISVTERVGTIARVRKMARMAAGAYLKQREELGFPLLREAQKADGEPAAEAPLPKKALEKATRG